MLKKVRKQITPATVMAFVALVFAITGGAFAATGGGSGGSSPSHATLTASAAKAKAKTKAGPRGPAGPKGATGATGATGPAGATGPGGPAGPAGGTGLTGNTGSNGTSVTSKEQSTGTLGPCKAGGSEFTSASGATYACNGAKGATGPEGPSGSFGGPLPPEKTETGTWSVAPGIATGFSAFVAVSFPAPLEAVIQNEHEHVFFVTEAEANSKANANCPGNAEDPQAAVGDFCFYVGSGENLKYEGTSSPAFRAATVGTSGGFVSLGATAQPAYGSGAWAVTAPPKA